MSHSDPADSLAERTFVITMIATVLYALAVYFFVLAADVPDPGAPANGAER
ncbi:MAG TPA: hypothetical protein VHC69_14730 [Polyangiaceae bacterium]|nr:hypothetical protein [Polyangiaceae bacterium]